MGHCWVVTGVIPGFCSGPTNDGRTLRDQPRTIRENLKLRKRQRRNAPPALPTRSSICFFWRPTCLGSPASLTRPLGPFLRPRSRGGFFEDPVGTSTNQGHGGVHELNRCHETRGTLDPAAGPRALKIDSPLIISQRRFPWPTRRNLRLRRNWDPPPPQKTSPSQCPR